MFMLPHISPYWHAAIEMLAYAVGFRVFLRERRRLALPSLADSGATVAIGVGAILGAAIGAKLSFWLDDPLVAFANFPDWRQLLTGKSIVGALLGGLIGVELTKRHAGVRDSTGDAFVRPLTLGMAIGRIGCFLAGLSDHTYGVATTLPWGVDFGDGVSRHPTQLYEIAFLAAWLAWLERPRQAPSQPGQRFQLFLSGYLLFRLLIDALKPVPFPYLFGLSGLQLLCLAGLAYYVPKLRAARQAPVAVAAAPRE
jgi:prolipoprotein diacylglyceryltransferase